MKHITVFALMIGYFEANLWLLAVLEFTNPMLRDKNLMGQEFIL
jgi:hypothetical protein